MNKQGSKNTPRLRCLLLKYRAKMENIKEREILLPYPCRHIFTRNVPQRGSRSKYFPLSHPSDGWLADAELHDDTLQPR